MMEPVLDRGRLDSITGGDGALGRELLSVLVDEATSLAADLDTLLAAGDLATLGERAHSLKGISGNVGASALQAASLRLQRAVGEAADRPLLARRCSDVATALAGLRVVCEAQA